MGEARLKMLRTLLYGLYKTSILYYAWLLFIIGGKLWAHFELFYLGQFSIAALLVAVIQVFLCWVHLAILQGIDSNHAWALMASVFISGVHGLCALALPGLDIYTTNFLLISWLVFAVTFGQFFSRLATLKT